jgi:uncharacterized protein (UPF0276 family)
MYDNLDINQINITHKNSKLTYSIYLNYLPKKK